MTKPIAATTTATATAGVAPTTTVWQPDLTARHYGRDRIEHVAFVPMPAALRNELITEAYGDLAEAMRLVVGANDATWCTFGQWASHAVGDVLRLPGANIGRLIAAAFGDGNRLVFADVGRAHAIFLETVGVAAGIGGNLDIAWDRCTALLAERSPAPPNRPMSAGPASVRSLLLGEAGTPDETQRALLVRGFRAYRDALDCTDADERSRTILLGNALIAVHEQQRLSEAITVGFRSWLRTITTAHVPLRTRYRWRNSDPKQWRLTLEDRWILFATQRLVGIDLPDQRLEVGASLPLSPNSVAVPPFDPSGPEPIPPLEAIATDELLGLVYDTFGVDGRPSTCWADLSDRMAYILRMFANEQRSPSLITPGGLLRRPIPRAELVDELERFETRVTANDPAGSGAPTAVFSIDQLDDLRSLPTHHFADELTGVSFQQVAQRTPGQPGPLAALETEFATRIATLSGPGGLLSSDDIKNSLDFFDESSTMIYMGLLFRSLPDGYAAAKGVKVLGTISDLATDPVRRVGETAQFLRDIFETDSSWTRSGATRRLTPDGPAAQSIFGVRLMHALVSRRLLDDDWDVDSYGFPINCEDLLGTALSFVVPVFEMLDDLGIDVSDEHREAYTHMWCAIGFLLGLPLESVTIEAADGRRFLTSTEAREVARLIRFRHHDRSLDGVRLGEALVAGVADGFPRFFDWVGTGLFQAVGNPEVNRILLATERRGRARSELVAVAVAASLRHQRTKVVARSFVRLAGRFWLEPFLAEGASRPFRRPLAEAEAGHLRPDPMVLNTDYWPFGLSN